MPVGSRVCPNCNWTAKPSKRTGLTKIIAIAAVFLVGVFIFYQVFEVMPNNKLISEAKNTPAYYGDLTYGKLLDSFCSSPKWSALGSRSIGDMLSGTISITATETVEFHGDSPLGEVFIQLTKNNKGEFDLNYMELSGRRPDEWKILEFFTSALNVISNGGSITSVEPNRTTPATQTVNSELSLLAYPNITVSAGTPVRWIIYASEDSINGCNSKMLIQEYDIEYTFQSGDNEIEFMPTETGTFNYSCWLGILRGTITVVE